MALKVRKQSLADQLILMIIELIRDGHLLSGEKLPGEAEFAASFDVSRNIMREALKILENFGILEAKNGIGTFISKCAIENIHNMNFFYRLKDNDSVMSILEMRLMIEPSAAYFAAKRIDEDGIADLIKLMEDLKEKYIKFPDYKDDFEIHSAIAHYSGNTLCEDLINSLLGRLQNSLYAEFNKYQSQKTKEDNRETHIALLQAISSHDKRLAQKLMYNHILKRILLINSSF